MSEKFFDDNELPLEGDDEFGPDGPEVQVDPGAAVPEVRSGGRRERAEEEVPPELRARYAEVVRRSWPGPPSTCPSPRCTAWPG